MNKFWASNLVKLIFLLVLLNGLLFWARQYIEEKTEPYQGYGMFILMPSSIYDKYEGLIWKIMESECGRQIHLPGDQVMVQFTEFNQQTYPLSNLGEQTQVYYSFGEYRHKVYGDANLIICLWMIAAIAFVCMWHKGGGIRIQVKPYN